MKTVIIHHHDLDGYAAGAIARCHYPEAATLSLNYDGCARIPTAETLLAAYDKIIVVDYTLPLPAMKALYGKGRLLWIDHHASAIRNAVAGGFSEAPGLRCAPGELVCAAELAWSFFTARPIPKLLRLIGDYDTFRNYRDSAFNDVVLPFFYATQVDFQTRFNPCNFGRAGYLFNSVADFEDGDIAARLIRDGRAIKSYNDSYFDQLLAESAFVRTIGGLRMLCFNCAGHGSANMVRAFNPAEHDAMLLFSFNGSGWNYGLYTDGDAKPEVDLSLIAQRYGGGGHRCAAGFHTQHLLPELSTPTVRPVSSR